MLQTRKPLRAVVLAAALVACLALPAIAAPADSVAGSLLGWLEGWLAWPTDAVARITGADEALPSAGLDGAVTSPLPVNGAGESISQTTGENDGEALPSADPNG